MAAATTSASCAARLNVRRARGSFIWIASIHAIDGRLLYDFRRVVLNCFRSHAFQRSHAKIAHFAHVVENVIGRGRCIAVIRTLTAGGFRRPVAAAIAVVYAYVLWVLSTLPHSYIIVFVIRYATTRASTSSLQVIVADHFVFTRHMDRDGLLRLFNLKLALNARGEISFITDAKLKKRKKYIVFRIDDAAKYEWAINPSGISNRALHAGDEVLFFFKAGADRYEVIDKSQSTFDASINYPNVQWTPESSVIIDQPRLRAHSVFLVGVEYSAYTALFHVLRSRNYSDAEKDTLWSQLRQENIVAANPHGYYSELFDAMLGVKLRCPPLLLAGDKEWTMRTLSPFFSDLANDPIQWLEGLEASVSNAERPSKHSLFANDNKRRKLLNAIEHEVIALACFTEYEHLRKTATTPNPDYKRIGITREQRVNTFFNTLMRFFHQGHTINEDEAYITYIKQVDSILSLMQRFATPSDTASLIADDGIVAETIADDFRIAEDDDLGFFAMVAWQLNGWPAQENAFFSAYTPAQRAAVGSAFKGAVQAATATTDADVPSSVDEILQAAATWKNVFIYNPRDKKEYVPSTALARTMLPAQYLILYHQRGKVIGDKRTGPLSYYVPELLYRGFLDYDRTK